MTDIPTGQCLHGHAVHYRYPCPGCATEETGVEFTEEFRVITRDDRGIAHPHGQAYTTKREAQDHERGLRHRVYGTDYTRLEIESRLVTRWETHSV